MENIISSFLSAPTLVFILIIYIAVVVFRKVVEFLASKIAHVFPDKYEPWWKYLWKNTILLAAPSFFGGLIAFFATGYPFPELFAGPWARVFFGMVCGLCTNNAYDFFNATIKKLLPKKVKEKTDKLNNSITPPSE